MKEHPKGQDLFVKLEVERRAQWIMDLYGLSDSHDDQTYLKKICDAAGVELNQERLKKAISLYAQHLSAAEWQELQKENSPARKALEEHIKFVSDLKVLSNASESEKRSDKANSIVKSDNRVGVVIKALNESLTYDAGSFHKRWKQISEKGSFNVRRSIKSYLATLDSDEVNILVSDIRSKRGANLDYLLGSLEHYFEKQKTGQARE